MTGIDPLVLKITNLKVEASKRGLWQTVKALDTAERGYVSDVIRIGKESRRCSYCWGGNGLETDLREIEMRSHAGRGPFDWGPPTFVGEKCRDYLRGLFRYTIHFTPEYDPLKGALK